MSDTVHNPCSAQSVALLMPHSDISDDTSAELRAQALRARLHAIALSDQTAAAALRAYADELEAKAVALDAECGMPEELRDHLPTARDFRTSNYRLIVWCKACRHQTEMPFPTIVEQGKGDVPLIDLRFRCENCGSRLTDSAVSGSHMVPRRN